MNTKPNAKNILCFGDSNTWGAMPYSEARLPLHVSWPGEIQNILGGDYEIISEGLFGRTLVAEDAGKPFKTGLTHLKAILMSHQPLDLLIIMLGTNDVKDRYHLTAGQIAAHLSQLVSYAKEILKDDESKILIICPPAVVVPENGELDSKIVSGLQKFKELPNLYKQVAADSRCFYLDANDYVSLSKTDGYHLDEAGHKDLAIAIAGEIKKIFKA